MQIVKSINKIKHIEDSVVTIGNFDGLHKGHQKLIKKIVDYGLKNNIKSVVFTFENHPANYFKENSIKNIITNEEKEERIKSLGVDIIINVKFDDYMANISSDDFVKNILVDKLGVNRLIVGHDFTFGKNKEGNINTLEDFSKKYSFKLEIVKPIKINKIRVSSTYIRELIKSGQVNLIKEYLGYNYDLKGIVIHAKQLGRTIGFPTANINCNNESLVPKCGIYATKVQILNRTYLGATNIGYNPTVNGDKLSIETHILDFDEDIYDEIIKIEFLERIRDEKKFSSLDDLKNQLEKDTRYVFENYICKIKEYMIY